MKAICCKSGITISVPEFGGTAAGPVQHPIFSASATQLVRYYTEYQRQRLSEQETILLFLAIADSTQHIIWETPFKLTDNALPIFNNHFGQLVSVVNSINTIRHPGMAVPQFAVRAKSGSNVAGAFIGCIDAWRQCVAEFGQRHRVAAEGKELLRLEAVIARSNGLLRSRPKTYARVVAEWADVAGQFPNDATCTAHHPMIPRNEYWKEIIRDAIVDNSNTKHPIREVAAVLEWCESEIEMGSTHGYTLLTALRAVVINTRKSVDFGVLTSASSWDMRILPLDPEERRAVQSALDLAKDVAANAPANKPLREHYATDFQFLRASAAWRAAKSLEQHALDNADNNNNAALAGDL